MLLKNICLKAFLSLICTTAILSLSIFTPNNITVNAANLNYTTENNHILKNGVEIQLKGVNWFGADTQDLVVHGLWSRGYKSMIQQMKDLGFNAVRIPFCPATLKNQTVTSYINSDQNPDLVGLKSLDILDKVLNELNRQGMYFVLDHHRPDCNSISELWYTSGYTEAQWINDLKFVAQRYANLPYFAALDLKNEPHGAATWNKNSPATDWNQAAERAGQQVLSVNPGILIFVEGIETNSSSCESTSGHFWGGDLEPVNCSAINTDSVPANKVVYSPHVYGKDVYNMPYFSDSNFPNNLPTIWDRDFGALISKGKTISVGEFGTKYGHGGGNPTDIKWLDKFVDYMSQKRICSTFYWSWNPNSGDTGGILQDDWQSVWSDKVNILKKLYTNCDAALNKEPSKGTCKIEYATKLTWSNGYQGSIKIYNTTSNDIKGWTLTFDMPSSQKVYKNWSSKYLGRTGLTSKLTNESWNGSIPANGSVDFGFVGTLSSPITPIKPANYILNGQSCQIN